MADPLFTVEITGPGTTVEFNDLRGEVVVSAVGPATGLAFPDLLAEATDSRGRELRPSSSPQAQASEVDPGSRE